MVVIEVVEVVYQGGVSIESVVILLVVVVIFVLLFWWLGFGLVLGYLVGGLVIGFFGFGLFGDLQVIIYFVELGVVLFLFVIGLEMQFLCLWFMCGEIFGFGFVQVVLVIGVLICVGLVFGFFVVFSFVVGMGFVLILIVIVMQMLDECWQMVLFKGCCIIVILLLEDFVIVFLLVLVVFFVFGGFEVMLFECLISVVIGFGVIVVLVVVGCYLLNLMFGLLVCFGGCEMMMVVVFLVVLGVVILMQVGGFFMVMGVFFVGVFFLELIFCYQFEVDIEFFCGLLLGLFFFGVGMVVDLDIIVQNWVLIVICVFVYMILKMGVIYIVVCFFCVSGFEVLECVVFMVQGGEFVFVFYVVVMGVGIILEQENVVLMVIVIVLMVLMLLMIILYDWLVFKFKVLFDGVEVVYDFNVCVLMIGFGCMGQIISQLLIVCGYLLFIIEKDL